MAQNNQYNENEMDPAYVAQNIIKKMVGLGDFPSISLGGYGLAVKKVVETSENFTFPSDIECKEVIILQKMNANYFGQFIVAYRKYWTTFPTPTTYTIPSFVVTPSEDLSKSYISNNFQSGYSYITTSGISQFNNVAMKGRILSANLTQMDALLDMSYSNILQFVNDKRESYLGLLQDGVAHLTLPTADSLLFKSIISNDSFNYPQEDDQMSQCISEQWMTTTDLDQTNNLFGYDSFVSPSLNIVAPIPIFMALPEVKVQQPGSFGYGNIPPNIPAGWTEISLNLSMIYTLAADSNFAPPPIQLSLQFFGVRCVELLGVLTLVPFNLNVELPGWVNRLSATQGNMNYTLNQSFFIPTDVQGIQVTMDSLALGYAAVSFYSGHVRMIFKSANTVGKNIPFNITALTQLPVGQDFGINALYHYACISDAKTSRQVSPTAMLCSPAVLFGYLEVHRMVGNGSLQLMMSKVQLDKLINSYQYRPTVPAFEANSTSPFFKLAKSVGGSMLKAGLGKLTKKIGSNSGIRRTDPNNYGDNLGNMGNYNTTSTFIEDDNDDDDVVIVKEKKVVTKVNRCSDFQRRQHETLKPKRIDFNDQPETKNKCADSTEEFIVLAKKFLTVTMIDSSCKKIHEFGAEDYKSNLDNGTIARMINSISKLEQQESNFLLTAWSDGSLKQFFHDVKTDIWYEQRKKFDAKFTDWSPPVNSCSDFPSNRTRINNSTIKDLITKKSLTDHKMDDQDFSYLHAAFLKKNRNSDTMGAQLNNMFANENIQCSYFAYVNENGPQIGMLILSSYPIERLYNYSPEYDNRGEGIYFDETVFPDEQTRETMFLRLRTWHGNGYIPFPFEENYVTVRCEDNYNQNMIAGSSVHLALAAAFLRIPHGPILTGDVNDDFEIEWPGDMEEKSKLIEKFEQNLDEVEISVIRHVITGPPTMIQQSQLNDADTRIYDNCYNVPDLGSSKILMQMNKEKHVLLANNPNEILLYCFYQGNWNTAVLSEIRGGKGTKDEQLDASKHVRNLGFDLNTTQKKKVVYGSQDYSSTKKEIDRQKAQLLQQPWYFLSQEKGKQTVLPGKISENTDNKLTKLYNNLGKKFTESIEYGDLAQWNSFYTAQVLIQQNSKANAELTLEKINQKNRESSKSGGKGVSKFRSITKQTGKLKPVILEDFDDDDASNDDDDEEPEEEPKLRSNKTTSFGKVNKCSDFNDNKTAQRLKNKVQEKRENCPSKHSPFSNEQKKALIEQQIQKQQTEDVNRAARLIESKKIEIELLINSAPVQLDNVDRFISAMIREKRKFSAAEYQAAKDGLIYTCEETDPYIDVDILNDVVLYVVDVNIKVNTEKNKKQKNKTEEDEKVSSPSKPG